MAVDYVKKRSYGGYIYLRPVTLKESKITGDLPGHTLDTVSHFSDLKHQESGIPTFNCSCGFSLRVWARATGATQASAQRSWNQHLEKAGTSPNDRFNVGTVKRKKGPLQTVFVALGAYHDASSYLPSTGGYRTKEGWSVFVDADDKKLRVGQAETKTHALTQASKFLDTAQRRGSIVERDAEVLSIPGTVSVRGALASLLTVDIKSFDQVQAAKDALDEVLLLVPMLEDKRKELDDITLKFVNSLFE